MGVKKKNNNLGAHLSIAVSRTLLRIQYMLDKESVATLLYVKGKHSKLCRRIMEP